MFMFIQWLIVAFAAIVQASAAPCSSSFVGFHFPQLGIHKARQSIFASSGQSSSTATRELEEKLLSCIDRRLSNSDEISKLVQQLEQEPSIPNPAIAPEIYGKWRLVHTTNADTSSPIQRKAVDSIQFPIYQNIIVNEQNQLVVSQVVRFSDSSELCVDALASTSAYPLPELTERQSSGKILGLNILGVSLVGKEAEPDAEFPDRRIDFVFDEGKFDLFGGKFQLPYPVPFRNPLFRDAVKGWIDVTYLSENVRISRGNKGTTFVLVKEE